MVAKHRRFDDPSPGSAGATFHTGEFEAIGYSRSVTATGLADEDSWAWSASSVAEPGWTAGTRDPYWQDGPPDWRDWGPPPALHPDHPSAPVPRIEYSDDRPSRGPRRPANSGQHETVTRRATAVGYLSVQQEVSGYRQQPGQARREAAGYQRHPNEAHQDVTAYRRHEGAGRRETADYRHTGAQRPSGGPASDQFYNDRFYNGRAQDGDSLWVSGQVLTEADGHAAQIARQAQADAAAIREAAERDAATIRAEAQREAVELRARLDAILGSELGQVVTNYITQSLALPAALPTPAPAEPVAEPVLPRRASALPATTPAGPGTAPAKPASKPLTKEQRQGRQKRAMRFAKYGTAAMLILALGAAGLEMHHNGYGFFVFRENGQGDSPSSGPGRVGVDQVDSQFLAAQAAARAKAAQQAPQGRHHKPSTATSTTGG